MKTLPLNPATWDLVLDANGNLNLEEPYLSVAQDIASAWKTFLGECWYDTALGMPLMQSIFAQLPPTSLVVAKLTDQAFTIADVKDVRIVSLQLMPDRTLTGQGAILTDYNTQPLVVTF